MSTVKDLRKSALIFAALGDETRLALVQKLIVKDEASLSELADGMPITRQAVSKHLRVLEEAELIDQQPVGRETRYIVNKKNNKNLLSLLETVDKRWDQRLRRLKMFVENT